MTKEQFLEIEEKYEKLEFSVKMLFLHGYISETQKIKIMNKMFDKMHKELGINSETLHEN